MKLILNDEQKDVYLQLNQLEENGEHLIKSMISNQFYYHLFGFVENAKTLELKNLATL